MHHIEGDNVTTAWAEAVRLIHAHGGELNNLTVSIAAPTQIEENIHGAYKQLLVTNNLKTLKQVVYTVFPYPIYEEVNHDAGELFRKYNQPNGIYDRLKRKYPHQFRWGTYFRRMTHYPIASNDGGHQAINQLSEIIAMMSTRRRVFRAAYTINIQVPGKDCRLPRGAPCLNYIALQLNNSKVLDFLAVYRNHDFIQRAYGNYLSLGYLMKFLCDQTGYTLGTLHCVSSHATIRNVGGHSPWPTIDNIMAILQITDHP